MEPTGVKRKLAVILAADAEGYTRLMHEAEEPTLETLTDYREIIDGLIVRLEPFPVILTHSDRAILGQGQESAAEHSQSYGQGA